jgi:hypothetical protein
MIFLRKITALPNIQTTVIQTQKSRERSRRHRRPGTKAERPLKKGKITNKTLQDLSAADNKATTSRRQRTPE